MTNPSGERGLRRPPASTPKLYAQDGRGYDAEVYAHYFLGASDWYVTEYDPAEDLAFGWCCLGGDLANAELGYASLAELESVRAPISINGQSIPHAVAIEHDDHWTPTLLRDALTARYGDDYGRTLPRTRLRGPALREARRAARGEPRQP